MRGNCYAASEALYHLLGGKKAGWKPVTCRVEGVTHWWLEHSSGFMLDVTRVQFKGKIDLSAARGRGFLTQKPSRKARALMRAIVWQED